MVCIRFQGIVIVLPIDKNKSKVFGKREGFFVLIKRTARSCTCEAVYVCVLVLNRKSYIEPNIRYRPYDICYACIVVRVFRYFNDKNQMECINYKLLCFMAIITMYAVPKNLKSFPPWLDTQLTNPTFVPIIIKIKFHE